VPLERTLTLLLLLLLDEDEDDDFVLVVICFTTYTNSGQPFCSLLRPRKAAEPGAPARCQARVGKHFWRNFLLTLPSLVISLPILDLIKWVGKDPPAIT